MFSRRQAKKDTFVSFKELLPRILVKDPVTHDTWDQGRFTTYLICIKTEHPAFHLRLSAVRRRFSELRWLYKVLQDNHSHVHFPKPPGKKIFAERFESEFINTRMMEIQNYLNELMVTDTVLSDAAFHFFVQTDLTIEEIQEYLNGTLLESIVTEAWENAGHLHTSSYIVNSVFIPHEPQEIVMNEEDLQQHVSRSLDASNSYSAAETSSDLKNPALTTVKGGEVESEDLNTPSEVSWNVADVDNPVGGCDEAAAADLTHDDGAVISPEDKVTNDDDVEEKSAELNEVFDDDKVINEIVISPKDELTNGDDVEEISELNEVFDDDDDKVITEIGNDVIKMTLPVKNV